MPVPYFHSVFTLPDFLRPVAWQNQAVVYDILFQSAATALQRLAKDPKHLGARIGLLAVLHTWNQRLLYHPHVHCLVPGGGLSVDRDRWIPAPSHKFFLPDKALSEVFRGVFMELLRTAYREGRLIWNAKLAYLHEPAAFNRFIQSAWKKDWVIRTKAPFAGPEEVVEYLGRYTHRIGISNNRLVSMDDKTVTFNWRDRKHDNRVRQLTLPGHEFMHRFLLHVPPKGFVRLRHYGFLANACRAQKLDLCRRLLQVTPPPGLPDPIAPIDWKTQLQTLNGVNIDCCPRCRVGVMRAVATLPPVPSARDRGPPQPAIHDSS